MTSLEAIREFVHHAHNEGMVDVGMRNGDRVPIANLARYIEKEHERMRKADEALRNRGTL
jgi:hypothetical protein